MLNTAHSDSPADADALADWPGWLEADGLLSPGLRESYRRTLEGFEQFCRKRAQGQGAPGTPAAAGAGHGGRWHGSMWSCNGWSGRPGRRSCKSGRTR